MKELSSLQRLYGSLGDPDLIGGLGAAREEEPGLPDLIQQHEATGNYQDALSCYEKLEESDMTEVESLAGQVRCYLNIDQPVTAASLAAGLVAQDQLLARELAPLQAEAAWQLSRSVVVFSISQSWHLSYLDFKVGRPGDIYTG